MPHDTRDQAARGCGKTLPAGSLFQAFSIHEKAAAPRHGEALRTARLCPSERSPRCISQYQLRPTSTGHIPEPVLASRASNEVCAAKDAGSINPAGIASNGKFEVKMRKCSQRDRSPFFM
jgi:hypothetical protein